MWRRRFEEFIIIINTEKRRDDENKKCNLLIINKWFYNSRVQAVTFLKKFITII